MALLFAVTRAASETIKALFKRQAGALLRAGRTDTLLVTAQNLEAASNLSYKTIFAGLRWGDLVAANILRKRANDGANAAPVLTDVPVKMPPEPYSHQPDPTVMPTQQNYAAHWGDVASFGFNNLMVQLCLLQ